MTARYGQVKAAADPECKTCNGTGRVLYTYPSNKPQPSHWFRKNTSQCPNCKNGLPLNMGESE